MICFDYRCEACKDDFEVIFQTRKDFKMELPCDCGGKMRQVWKSFGPKGRVGGEKGRYPRYEIQAGRVFQSASEEKAYLKEEGLIALGPDERRRSENVAAEPEWDSKGFQECMKEAWEETVEHGKVYPHKIVDTNSIKFIE